MRQRLQSPETIAPIEVGSSVSVHVWEITLSEVWLGDEAAQIIQDANSENDPAPDGLEFALARLSVTNTGDTPALIQLADFQSTGDDGILRTAPSMVFPDPPLQGVVDPGESMEGLVPTVVNSSGNATLWFRQTATGLGNESVVFALTDGATVPSFEVTENGDSDTGSSAESPAGFDQPVRTGGWEVTLLETIDGQQVYDLSDYRLQALGQGSAGSWLGIRAQVTNQSAWPAFFSATAFELADSTGELWNNLLTLTAPVPDISQTYLPGASREGWAVFQLQDHASTERVRFLPFTGASPRFFSFTGDVDAPSPATGESADLDPLPLDSGDTATTTENLVNLREDASAGGAILAELPIGTEVTITGDPVTADGYRWYPVDVPTEDASGFLVQDFLSPSDEGE